MADTARLAQQSLEPVKPQPAGGYFAPPQQQSSVRSAAASQPTTSSLASNGQHHLNHSPFDDIAAPSKYPLATAPNSAMSTAAPPGYDQQQFRNVSQPAGPPAPLSSAPPLAGGVNYANAGLYGPPAPRVGVQHPPNANGPTNASAGNSRVVTNGEVHRQQQQQQQQVSSSFQQPGVRAQGPPYPGPPNVTGSLGQQQQQQQPTMLSAARPQPTDWKRAPPNSLPVPYQHYSAGGPSPTPGSSVYTPSPATSEPPSAKSSRNPSPISTQRYDALEGQFPPTFNHSGPANSGALGPTRPVRPPPSSQANQLPPMPPPSAGGAATNARLPLPAQPAPSYAQQQQPAGNSHSYQQPPPGNYYPQQQQQQQPPRENSYPPAQPYQPPQQTNSFPPPPQTNSFSQPPQQTNSFPQPPQTNSFSQPQPTNSFPTSQQTGSNAQPQQINSFPQSQQPQGNTYAPQQGTMYAQQQQQQQPLAPPSGMQSNQQQFTGQPLPSTQSSRRVTSPQYPPMPGVTHMQPPPFQSQPGAPVEPAQWSGSAPPSHIQQQQQQQRIPAGPSMSGPTNQQMNYGSDRLIPSMRNLNLQNVEPVDLLCTRNILPPTPVEPPRVILPTLDPKTVNCSPDIFRCTLTKIPESQSVLQKCRLPLGIVIHPFKDLGTLPVVQCSVIVRCRTCRTYINPFVQFLDQRRWKCNLCFRVNELQEEFMFDPMTKTYGDPTRRPEIKSATIEFIAPSEYMLRPPQPAVYLFVLDVSYAAVETGYLRCFCETLLDKLENLPGDSRTRVGFMTYDNAIHFYNLAEGLSQPQMMVVSDIDDVFLPCPDNLLVNLHENIELVKDLLMQLPIQFMDSRSSDSALGAALQAAKKLVGATGGRITVMQVSLPNVGPGALKSREDPNLRAGKEVPNLGPANDFYKKLSLDCSGNQVAVDLFLLSSQYCDIATLSCISKYSGGNVHFYPGFHATTNPGLAEKFELDLKRYFTRKIGFEAVMRIRCTKGLSIHTFHGNFFVRSTDLLSLPNINPDSGFGMQMSIEESLSECTTACFQAALLYTSSKGERRIRVHTMCLPVSANVLEVINSGDQQAIACLLTKMAVDRCQTSSMPDARDALLNACVDAVTAYKIQQGGSHVGVVVPHTLRLLPLYILAIMKHVAFRLGTSTKLDERVYAMNQMKTLPLSYLMNYLYPSMYPIHTLDETNCVIEEDKPIVLPPLLNLTAEKFERQGVFLLDSGEKMFLYVCQGVNPQFCQNVLNVRSFDDIPERMNELPELETTESVRLRTLVNHLQSQRPFHSVFQVLRNNSKNKQDFLQHLIEDRTESTYSYYEFLKHIQQLINK